MRVGPLPRTSTVAWEGKQAKGSMGGEGGGEGGLEVVIGLANGRKE